MHQCFYCFLYIYMTEKEGRPEATMLPERGTSWHLEPYTRMSYKYVNFKMISFSSSWPFPLSSLPPPWQLPKLEYLELLLSALLSLMSIWMSILNNSVFQTPVSCEPSSQFSFPLSYFRFWPFHAKSAAFASCQFSPPNPHPRRLMAFPGIGRTWTSR